MNGFRVGFLLVAMLASLPAHASSVELREALGVMSGTLWSSTYEGYALADRILGHPIVDAEDLGELAQKLDLPRNRPLASELEGRLGLLQRAVAEQGMSWVEAARGSLVLAPERVSGRIEFLPIELAESGYGAQRESFLAGASSGERREVQIYLRGNFRAFQPDLLSRLETMGFSVKPFYRDSKIVMLGTAPEGSLRQLSGVDGVDRLVAPGVSPSGQRPGRGPLYYSHGVKAVVE